MKKFLFLLLSLLFLTDSYSQITRTHIGTSRYDLQTNASIQRRIAVHPTSKDVIVTYTGNNEADFPGYEKRGTGYMYFTTSNGQWSNYKNDILVPPIDTFFSRPDSTRVGWPNPLFVGNKEIIISHKASASGGFNGLHQISRTTSGAGSWTKKDITTGAETWPRVASNGNNLFVISSHSQSVFNGVDGGLMFIKSTDGGLNWSNPDSIKGIDGYNYPGQTTAGKGLSADDYSLDMGSNNKIAILTGTYDITLYTSSDMGNTWKKTSIFPTYYNQDGVIIPRGDRSNGEYSVLVDNSGLVHCFWSRYSSAFTGTGGSLMNEFTRSGIMYWNENMVGQAPRLIPHTDFIRESIHSPNFPFFRFNTQGGTIEYVRDGAYRNNTTAWPSTGIDASGTIYLTYAYNRGIIDTGNTGKGIDGDTKDGYNFYDIYVMKSTDTGKSWIGPTNVSSTLTLENTYPSMARLVDNHVHIVYQEDSLVGNAVMTVAGGGNGTGSQAGPAHTRNHQIYAKIPVTDIVSPTTDITSPTLRFSNKALSYNEINGVPLGKIVILLDCGKDTVSKVDFSKSKKFLLENYVEFYEDSSNFDVIGLASVNTSVTGTYPIRVTGKDASGNKTLALVTGTGEFIYFDTMNLVIEVTTDNIKPVLTILGANPAYVYLNGVGYPDSTSISDNNLCTSASLKSLGTVDLNTKGTYSRDYEATDGAGNKSTATRKIFVGVAPTAKITEEAITGNKLTAKGTTSLDVIPEAPTTYNWTIKNTGQTTPSTVIGGTPTLSNIVLTKSFDSLCLEVSNSFNSIVTPNIPKSKECKFLKYSSSISASVSNTLTVSVFPNPSNGDFNIKVEGNRDNKARVIITSMDGKTISNSQVEINGNQIPFRSNLSKGSYFISTEIDGQVHLEKIEVR